MNANKHACELASNKDQWRSQMRQKSASWLEKPTTARTAAQAAIEKNLHQIMQGAQGIWGCYLALPGEPSFDVFDHTGLMGRLGAVHWAFPKIETRAAAKGEAPIMSFFIPKTKDSFLETSAWGLREPNPAEARKIAPEDLAGLIIPALAFDRLGTRLGHGKGHYDKYLSGFRGTKVGVAHSWQLVEGLPREAFDIPMDIIVTDLESFRPQQELK